MIDQTCPKFLWCRLRLCSVASLTLSFFPSKRLFSLRSSLSSALAEIIHELWRWVLNVPIMLGYAMGHD